MNGQASSSKPRRQVLITGCLGGIGQALVNAFHEAGYRVLGLDRSDCPTREQVHPDSYHSCDLSRLVTEPTYRETVINGLREKLEGTLDALVNNAAYQVVKPLAQLTAAEWLDSQNVNVSAPFFLTQALLPELSANRGSVVNIASIHAQLTKPEFVAYATSKAALIGLTKALAIDLGKSGVVVNAIAPAAISTPMLVDGFAGREDDFQSLASMHPMGRIGEPAEVARVAVLLADRQIGFASGSVISLDGGISSRLHDPV
jgi:NAD(P)-dependent dehydrogenase (short-subunit alcohol dehydrogenase family)